MKKIITVILTAFIVLSCFGCGKKEEPNPYPDRDVTYSNQLPEFKEDAVYIHYQREDNKYTNWTLWLWDPSGSDDSKEDDFNYQDDYGVIAAYPLSYFGDLSEGRLGIIVKTKGSWTKDATDSDRFIVFSNLEKDEKGIYHIYLVGDDSHLYNNPDKVLSDNITTCMFYNESLVYVVCETPIESYKIYCNDELIKEASNAGKSFFSCQLDDTADFTKKYKAEILFRNSQETLTSEISLTNLYGTEAFNDMYYYDGQLGAIYSKNSTTFRVWSPVSSQITLRIYSTGTPTNLLPEGQAQIQSFQEFEMVKKDKGVFEATVEGDLAGQYYTYVVTNETYKEKEIVDPYAKSTGINGVRGMIVDFEATNPEGWDEVDYLDYDRKSLVVWEAHVADVTSSESWNGSKENQRKYLGLIETGTTYSENGVTVSTGFDHIKELGINALQLQPIFDHDNDERNYQFNWGYNPLNYNALEGLYSSDPYDGYAKIKEFKQVVMAYQKEGIEIIMDVVYNHVSGAVGSNFDVLMPGYYFRYNRNDLSNGSGCGNETASENAMMRKFIVDSICFWTKEYKLSGFRFDLMGLHDIETMNEVYAAASEINPNIVIYGEPWAGGTTTLSADLQAKQANANLFVGYGQFNDQMRDALIKGGLCGAKEKGWVTTDEKTEANDIKSIQYGIQGITYNPTYIINDVNKTVNYVTCHDNYTLYDRIVAAGITDEQTIRKMAVLANSVVLTSNGTTFMLAGEELLRTKQGDSNSYQSSDEINAIDYTLKIKNADVFENYKKLIEFKKNTSALQRDNAEFVVETLESGAILKYEFTNNGVTYLIVHANGTTKTTTLDTTGYSIYLDTLGINSDTVDSIAIQPYQTIILYK